MKRLIVALACLALTSIALADEPITKPVRYTWIASSCEAWNCAAAALVLAGGTKDVIVLPTGREEVPWIVLRRVEEGSVYIPDEEQFACEVFSTTTEASSRYDGMETCHNPLLLSVPDGRMVIASLKNCDGSSKRRAVK